MSKFFYHTLTFLLLISFTSCSLKKQSELHSPNEDLRISFDLNANGEAFYTVIKAGDPVIDTSFMSFALKDQEDLDDSFKIIDIKNYEYVKYWELPWGEKKKVEDIYNTMTVYLEETEFPYRKLNIEFRAYNDGVAFRYIFPEQDRMQQAIILDENTEFNLTEDYTCWWIPGDWEIYEHVYNTTKVSKINAIEKAEHVNLAQTSIPYNAVNTPFTMRSEGGLHISFHEANLTDYSGMTLLVDTINLKLKSKLVNSDRLGYAVKRDLPFNTPWRSIQISKDAAGLIESDLILNLNEPNKLGDVSWVQPMKYVGIWWEMHVGTASWDLASGRHGATTKNAKRYIDFAAANNIQGVLIEGWNTGWEHWIGFEDREGVFDFVTPYEDYDLEEVVRYAKEKGVEIVMHHETSAAPRTYEQQLDTAYKLMNRLGIGSVKTGYVGKIIPKGEYHHGQWMVNHYRKVLETAAKYKIAINAHEPIKATGIRRTYPNAIAREGLRGQEFNAWAMDGGNPPEHLSIVAFTRMLAGPIDFTPGVFNIKLTDKYPKPNTKNEYRNQINTTLAHQLALYVVINSPIQMACDLPHNYEGHPAFQFIRDVSVDWEQTKVLNGEVGDYVTIARKDESDQWFVGGITDENYRELLIEFDFLDESQEYQLTIYKDGTDAHWDQNPGSYKISTFKVDSKEAEKVYLAAGGGFAMHLKPIK